MLRRKWTALTIGLAASMSLFVVFATADQRVNDSNRSGVSAASDAGQSGEVQDLSGLIPIYEPLPETAGMDEGEPRGGCDDIIFSNTAATTAAGGWGVEPAQIGQALTFGGVNRSICSVTGVIAQNTSSNGVDYDIFIRIYDNCPTNGPALTPCDNVGLLYGPVASDNALATSTTVTVLPVWTIPDIAVPATAYITFSTNNANTAIHFATADPTVGTTTTGGGTLTACLSTISGCDSLAFGTSDELKIIVNANPGAGSGACCNDNVSCIITTAVNCNDPLDRFVPGATCANAGFNPPCGTFVAGDQCTTPIALSGQSAMSAYTTIGAFSQATPTVSCTPTPNSAIFHDVWFLYTTPLLAPATTVGGTVVVSTIGSDFDTMLVVYGPIAAGLSNAQICTGITNQTIPEVACIDDIRPENLLSFLQFNNGEPDNGVRYMIRVGSLTAAESGSGMLNVDYIPNSDGSTYLQAGRCCTRDGLSCTIVNRAVCDADPNRFWQEGTRFMEGADPAISAAFFETSPIGCKTLPCPVIGDACYNAIDLEVAMGGPQGTHTRGIGDKTYFKYTLGAGETLVLDSCGSSFDSVMEIYATIGDFGLGSDGDCGNLIKINDDCIFNDIDDTAEGASQDAGCYAPAGEVASCLCVSRDEVDAADPAANGRIIIAVGGFNPFRADTGVAAVDPVLNPFGADVGLTLNATLITQCFVCEVQNVVGGNPVTPILETESNCSDGTSNRTNDGCSIPGTPLFQTLPAPTPGNPIHVRGTAGVYVDSQFGQRPDNDWYEINFASNVRAEFRLVAAEFPARLSIFRAGQADPCLAEAASAIITTISCTDTEDFYTEDLCAGRYFFRIRSEPPNKPACDADYLFRISVTAPPASNCCKADMNQDGLLNGRDVQRFVNALTQGVFDATSFGPCFVPEFCRADMNNSGTLTIADVPLFVTAILTGTPCPAQPLCSNPDGCQLPDQANALTSDAEAAADLRVADNFTPLASGNITNLCWWGMYFNFTTQAQCNVGAVDAFTVTIYNDAAGCPGSVVSTQSVTPTRTSTGTLILGAFNEFQYSAALTTPVAVTAGQCYWLEIRNNVAAADCFWLWETSAKGDFNSVQHDGAIPYACPADDTGTDQAFCLNLNIGPTGCVDLTTPGQCCYLNESQISTCVQTDINRCIIQFNGYYFDLNGVCGVDACPAPPCEVTCTLPGDIPENEGCGYDKNGGCNDAGASFPPFHDLGVLSCGTPKNVCGNAFSDGTTRDTDWYQFSIGAEAQVSVSLSARVDDQVILARLSPDCANLVQISALTSPFNDCAPTTIQACLQPGTYVVVVTGSATFTPHDCDVDSTYRLVISCSIPCCSVTCPGGTTQETEVCNQDTNGGCNNDPNPATFESLGNLCTTTTATRCGTSWAANNNRDTDWWGPITLTQPTEITWTLTSEFPGVAFAIRVNDCASLFFSDGFTSSVGCQPGTITECLPAGQWAIFVGPGNSDGSGVFDGVPCGTRNDYTLTVSCGATCEIQTEPGDECVTADTIAVPSTTDFDNSGATTNPDDFAIPCFFSGTPTVPMKTRWFVFTAPPSGNVTVSTCNAGTTAGDTIVSVYEECGPPWTMVGCSDDDAGCAIDGYFSRAVMTGLVSGEDYFISVGSFVGTEDFSGPIRMVVTTP